MKPFEIREFGDSCLRTPASEVTAFHKKLGREIDRLWLTLRSADNGAALAAPQVAWLKRVVVIDYVGEQLELVNPVILEAEGEEIGMEGCLSFPGYVGDVVRAARVKVRFQDRTGKRVDIVREDDMARCLQHEIDHLDGVLYIDRAVGPLVTHRDSGNRLTVPEAIAIAGPPPRPVSRPGARSQAISTERT